jgi:DNA-binding MarR family transcriptional regulator
METAGTLIHEAIANLQRLTALVAARREQLARQTGLTVAQWEVLEGISDEHFMPSLFARERESSPAAVSKILRQLLEKGLIRVRISRTDGRQRRYALTPRGRRTMAALRAARERAIQAIWMDLSPRELDGFNRFSGKLATRLETHIGQQE